MYSVISPNLSVSLTTLPFYQGAEKPSAEIHTGLLVLSTENAYNDVCQPRW